MKYNQGVLETVVRTVPAGDVVADTAYVIGAEILVAVEDGTAGADGVFVKRGCCGLEFLAGDEPAAGAACYLNNTTHKIEATPSATNYLIGCRNSNLESDIPATHVMVDLDGTAASVYGTPGDIQGVTAGTGLSGGGTSGTVTLSIGTSVVTNTTGDAASADLLVASAAADRSVKATSIAVANVPQMPAVGGVEELLYTPAADRSVVKSGLTRTNTPQMANDAPAPDLVLLSAAADKTLKASIIGLSDLMLHSKIFFVDVTIALGATSGSSAANPTLVNGGVLSYYPKSGNNQSVTSIVVNGDGSVTVTVAGNETAESVFAVAIYAV